MFNLKLYLYTWTCWSRSAQMAFMAAIYMGIALAGYGLFLHHNQQLLTEKKNELKHLSLQQSIQEAQIKKIPEHERQGIMKNVYSKDTLLQQVENLAQETQINLVNISANEAGLNILMQCDYMQLLYFIDALNATPHLLLAEFNIKSFQENVLQAQIYFHIYQDSDHV